MTDPSLPVLACNAAIEVDDLILGRTTELLAVRQLGQVLAAALTDAGALPASDPAMVSALNSAIGDSALSSQPTTTRELIEQAASISGALNRASRSVDVATLSRLRAFCLALSRRASSFRFSPMPASAGTSNMRST
jgi:hypothetical protein